MRLALLRFLAYIGSRQMERPQKPLWRVVRPEWTVEVHRDLMYQARAGRLFWIPLAVRADMTKIGIGNAFADCGGTVYGHVRQLVLYIDQLRWSRCPEENSHSLLHIFGRVPVYYSGDYFWFDPRKWVVLAGPEFLISTDTNGSSVSRWMITARGCRRYFPRYSPQRTAAMVSLWAAGLVVMPGSGPR